MPRFAMIQTPVFSLQRRLRDLTAGVYIDEFAELHTKDLVVRERLGHNVPSAGVGTAFSREAFDHVAESNRNQVFRLDSLTEDYDFGFRLGELGLKSIFVRFPVEHEVTRRPWWSTKPRKTIVRDYVATREYFPNKFWASVRQKTRWVIGIALQGWEHLGWRGSWRTKYVLFRDRKILFTSTVNILGYVVVSVVAGFWLYEHLADVPYRFSPLAGLDGWVLVLLVLNGAFFLLRLVQSAISVTRLYGIRQGLMSAPRLVLGNVIMFLGCWRAMWQ
ncbi:MAG: glycosyltransferase [Deltaproteobacteria bacterium]|nr:glycosyltransferase [Deltaproteobacteria bacterium]